MYFFTNNMFAELAARARAAIGRPRSASAESWNAPWCTSSGKRCGSDALTRL